MQKVVLIKLGGSIITNKEIPMSLRSEVLSRLVREIALARAENPNLLFVIAHGSGSFAHVPASQYHTMDGLVNDESLIGMAIVLDTAAQLNRIVVRAFLEANIPAVSVAPSQAVITSARKAETYFLNVFEDYLRKGLLPITYGDVLLDSKQGCTIWSTEEVLAFFAQKFREKGWAVQQVIHVTEVDGVHDISGQIVPHISRKNVDEVSKALTSTKGFDVTGGMGLKIYESVKLTELGITSKILSGHKKNNLYYALLNQPFVGTTIS